MAKAKRRDFAGAIVDYSAAMGHPDVPADIRAMVTYNRALAYSALHIDTKAVEDLDVVLHMPGVSKEIAAAARDRQERLRRRQNQADRV